MAEQGMVEAVARALARHDNPKYENWWPSYERRARAAIEAMREPTEAMLAAAKPEPTHLYGQGGRGEEYQAQMRVAVQVDRMVARTIWQAMIDQALATPEASGDE